MVYRSRGGDHPVCSLPFPPSVARACRYGRNFLAAHMRTTRSQHGAADDGGIELVSLGDERHGRRQQPPASAARAGETSSAGALPQPVRQPAASGNKHARSAPPASRRATTPTCIPSRSIRARRSLIIGHNSATVPCVRRAQGARTGGWCRGVAILQRSDARMRSRVRGSNRLGGAVTSARLTCVARSASMIGTMSGAVRGVRVKRWHDRGSENALT